MINYFTDTKSYYAYLCVSGATNSELKAIVEALKESGLEPLRFYSEPRFPASDGKMYDFLFRLPFTDSIKKSKPEPALIDKILSHLSKKDSSTNVSTSFISDMSDIIEREKSFLIDVRNGLDKERQILSRDKEYLQTQLKNLESIIQRVKKDNMFFIKSLNESTKKMDQWLQSAPTSNGQTNGRDSQIETLQEQKELLLIERESAIIEVEKSLQKEKEEFQKYKAKQEEQYKNIVDEFRSQMLDINSPQFSANDNLLQNVHIFIAGSSKITAQVIIDIFNDSFSKVFDMDLPKNAITIGALEYEKLKNLKLVDKIKSDKYDFILLGPRPHSIKGKAINMSGNELKKAYSLKAMIYDDAKNDFSQELILTLSKSFAELWKKKSE
jgi:hypothetical protein